MKFHMLQRFSDGSVAIKWTPGGKWTVDDGWPIACQARQFAGLQNRWIQPWFSEAIMEDEFRVFGIEMGRAA
jgi:hypothetical protein